MPQRHISLRVPWHDAEWNGTVCRAPHLNGACSQLKGIAGLKNDAAEREIAGVSLQHLPEDKWPPCVSERGAFMAPFETTHLKRHALGARDRKNYGHFRPTRQRYPAYSAGAVPFRWLLKESLETYGERYGLDVDPAREPDLGYKATWVNHVDNQRALLDGFASHLHQDESLCFFYAKHVPFVEGTGRILVGVGRIAAIGELSEFERGDDGPRGMIWERPIQHSVRSTGHDGFLLPYREVLARAQLDPLLDVSRYVADAPQEHWDEFSFGSELVTNDAAIGALLSLDAALGRMEDELGLPVEQQRVWIHAELARLWRVRGPYPGLGSVLAAAGLSRGVFLGHELQRQAGENQDPWPLVDRAFRNPTGVPAELRPDLMALAPMWQGLPDQRRAYLRLLSRFSLELEQAQQLFDVATRGQQGWSTSDAELLANPYLIYEISRHDRSGVSLPLVDRGVFPDDSVRLRHPLDGPTRLDSPVDARRVRAFAVDVLERDAAAGHTLQPLSDLAITIASLGVRPPCPVTSDILAAQVPELAPAIVASETAGVQVLQLTRYADIGELIRKQVRGRINGRRLKVPQAWGAMLEQRFGKASDDHEHRARSEKARALAELGESRISVLIGPAGTGKTTVLSIFCNQAEIQGAGVLLLAPTGKARVRLQELAGTSGARALTIAQFLNQHGRYDGANGRYHLSDGPKASGFATVIVDEASMLTEDMLGALLDALQGVQRLILVGDPSQLPPIGAGRPFVDIVTELAPHNIETAFPRVAQGYAELTVEMRQVGEDRPDLRLARWFSRPAPSVGEDDIFDAADESHAALGFVRWESSDDFQDKLMQVLTEELGLEDPEDQLGFNRQLGAMLSNGYAYFNGSTPGQAETGAVRSVENWQILTPLRGYTFGVREVNRLIHNRFRSSFLDLANRQRRRPIPRPLGAEQIVYGDKVINLSNHRRAGGRVWPQEGALGYLANGEIGIAFSKWAKQTEKAPPYLNVEFASQPGYRYSFSSRDFGDEGDPALELAYALTIHKAQGSQFRLVILIVPEAHPILSRELIYTALTRQQERVVIMHQGPRSLLRELSAPHRSETARRRTNLLSACRMVEVTHPGGSVFAQEGLIHRTSQGLAVRSKSELLIAQALHKAGVNFSYEKPLTLGGSTRYPDFTIEDDISGRTVYWEHLGMLDRPEYRRAWEAKRRWYEANGIHEAGERDDADAVLVTTSDSAEQGLDMSEVDQLIRRWCGG